MAEVTFDGVGKVYPDGTRAVSDMSLDDHRRGVHGLRRPVGLRQDDRAADGRRARGDLARACSRSASASSTTCPRATATSRWCSRATRSTRTSRVYENIAFGLRLKKVKKEEIDRRVNEAARILGLEPFLKRKPRALSGGQRQRVAMGARDRARAAGVPDGRAALEPRREAPRPDARGDREAPARPRHDDDLRHARPGRGDDDGRPRRRHAQGRAAAGRRARRSSTTGRSTSSSAGSSARPAMNMVEATLERRNGGLAAKVGLADGRARRGDCSRPHGAARLRGPRR